MEGVALCFDEWANGGDHGVMMFFNGATVWEDITESGNRSGDPPVSYFEDAAWHSVVFYIAPADGNAMLSFDFDSGVYGINDQVAADYALPADVYIGFTGRTGGATNNHWARNIQYAVGDATPSADMQERVCEGGTLSIDCGSGSITVVGASYGRQHGPDVCPHAATSNQDCHAENSVDIVSAACAGESSCTVDR